MKKFILVFHHLIVLVWLILVVTIFKITTNFKFKNGTSLIFIALIISFPTFIYIYTTVNKKRLRRQKSKEARLYFNQIKENLKKNIFKEQLLDKIDNLGLEYKLDETSDVIKITLYKNSNTLFYLMFTTSYAVLQLPDTEVIYYFYYSNHLDEFNKYSLRNFEYKETKILYLKIMEKISGLINKTYIYIQSKKLIKLINQETEEAVFELKLNKKLFSNLKKEKKIIELK